MCQITITREDKVVGIELPNGITAISGDRWVKMMAMVDKAFNRDKEKRVAPSA